MVVRPDISIPPLPSYARPPPPTFSDDFLGVRKVNHSFRHATPTATLNLEGIALRNLAFVLLLSSTAFSQNLTELGAVTAGSVIGGASGKSVSNGLSAIFGKVDQQTAKAAAIKPPVKKDVPEPPPVRVVQGLMGGHWWRASAPSARPSCGRGRPSRNTYFRRKSRKFALSQT